MGNYIPDEYAPIEWAGGFAKIVKPIFKRNFYEACPVSDYNNPISVSYKTKEFKQEKWVYFDEYKRSIEVYLWKRIS